MFFNIKKADILLIDEEEGRNVHDVLNIINLDRVNYY